MRTMAVGLALVLGASGVLPVVGADAATIRIKCRDGARASASGFGNSRDLADACDADRTCDGRCTFVLAGNIQCLVKAPRLGCASGDESRSPCPTLHPVFTLDAAPGSRLYIPKGQIGDTAFTLVCRPSKKCVAPTSTTLPIGVPDVGGIWSFTPDATSHDCPPEFAGRFGRPNTFTVQQDGTNLAACRNPYNSFRDGAIDGPDAVRFVSYRHSTTVGSSNVDYQETLAANGFSPAHAPNATMTLAFEDSATDTPVCSGTTSGSLVPMACADDDACIAADGCSRCIGGRCRQLPRCRWEDWCVFWKRRCLNPADYGGPFP